MAKEECCLFLALGHLVEMGLRGLRRGPAWWGPCVWRSARVSRMLPLTLKRVNNGHGSVTPAVDAPAPGLTPSPGRPYGLRHTSR